MATSEDSVAIATEPLPSPSVWPNANARLLGAGMGLPVAPLDRLAQFDSAAFERFILEWAHSYLREQEGIFEVQQRGGAGDKGRDVVVWYDPPSSSPRRWSLFQCKHLANRLGLGAAAAEIAKILFYTHRGDYTAPLQYWFVTHMGVTSDLQDYLDQPEKLRAYILDNWSSKCAEKITSTETIPLDADLKAHIGAFDFSVFRAKQPIDLIEEHKKSPNHLVVFGAPLIERPLPPQPPSSVQPQERRYIEQLYEVFSEDKGVSIQELGQLDGFPKLKRLFEHSRMAFFSAEGLKQLARDNMADASYFDGLLNEMLDALFHTYTARYPKGIDRMRATITNAQQIEIAQHTLGRLATANDRDGMCHHLANEDKLQWCDEDD